MLARELLGTAQVPGGEELRLYSHGRDFMIVLDRNELMSTRMRGSEEALAVMSLERLAHVAAPHLLIGGYGMGFTLRAALKQAPPKAKITVAELVPEIIEWARGPMAEVADGCLDDPRVTVRMGDVADAIAERPGRYDAILLDVDNGPDGLVCEENDRIYSNAGLAAAHRALTPEGVLAIWSAAPDPRFTKQLQRARFHVEPVEVSARYDAKGKGKGPKHTIWFCSRREG
ncbi:spermidine synthase [Croceicoccus sp. Ery15]|uniref:spermidine synthase n=1 Tax=Croceicoccus sp. Ery15 TaxID=1703338 RepID=UPI001E3AC89D|nr:spermidine synthase [Croceicoccus sp. Ery15]